MPQDAEGIAKVQVQCWQKNLSTWAPPAFVARFDVATQSEKYKHRIADPTATIMVARFNEEIIGVVGAKPNILPPDDYQEIIFGMYVSPDHQRIGVGKSLLESCLVELQKKGISSAVVFTFAANKPARNLYGKSGGILLPFTDSASLDLKIPHVSYGFDVRN